MKGYWILFVITALFLASLPPLVLPQSAGQAASPSVTAPSEELLTVKHTESDQSGTISAYDLTLYETMAQIAPDAPLEAIKAQVVAVYTSLCYQQAHEATITSTALVFPQGYTDVYWQEQWGEAYATNRAVYDDAMKAVFGQTITYGGDPIMAVTHAMNSGTTEDGVVLFGSDIPYLKSVASAADALDVGQLTTVTVSTADARKVLVTMCEEVSEDAAAWFGKTTKTAAGTVTAIIVCGKTLTGSQLQAAFSLPSAAFEVSVLENNVIFTVHGIGHFTGMSLCGAIAMAQNGQSYETILKHYYTGVTLA